MQNLPKYVNSAAANEPKLWHAFNAERRNNLK